METLPLPKDNTRIGFYYYPDTMHYRESDLSTWLPELKALGTSWLTLRAPVDRAIPEHFLRSLIAAGIEPVLHFNMKVDTPTQLRDLRLLFNTYARWGVNYVVLFDRPNTKAAWSTSAWAQSNLVERFLDIYIPVATAAHQAGLIPVFPPMEPGGDYWDTAFLRAALNGLHRRGCPQLLEKPVLGAYAWVGEQSLNWGAGGPERWPGSRPYFTPQNSEDQLGFRIFDWYLTIARAVLHTPCHILIMGGGVRYSEQAATEATVKAEISHSEKNLSIAALMTSTENHLTSTEELEPVPAEVLTCNFWLLAGSDESEGASQAWFRTDGTALSSAGALRQWMANRRGKTPVVSNSPVILEPQNGSAPEEMVETFTTGKTISHYLLLPVYEWGISDWHLDVIRPFLKKYKPTVGFSLAEAKASNRVTVVGGSPSFHQSIIEELKAAGCSVHHIGGDGTSIATQLAAL
jgi:hypothetical protein